MKRFLLLALLLNMGVAQAKSLGFSGKYECTGDDAHEGKYTGVVTMQIKPAHSKGDYAGYDFTLEVPGFGTYSGHAAAHGTNLAMHFALPMESGQYGGKNKDYGTGIAKMRKNRQGKWTFHKFYFEPEFKGGNTGLEDCVQK